LVGSKIDEHEKEISLRAFSDYSFCRLDIFEKFADLTVYGESGETLWRQRYELATPQAAPR